MPGWATSCGAPFWFFPMAFARFARFGNGFAPQAQCPVSWDPAARSSRLQALRPLHGVLASPKGNTHPQWSPPLANFHKSKMAVTWPLPCSRAVATPGKMPHQRGEGGARLWLYALSLICDSQSLGGGEGGSLSATALTSFSR